MYMYQISKEVILDPFDKLYKTVFTINKCPPSLKNIIKTAHMNKLSPFSSEPRECKYIFIDPEDNRKFLTTDKVSDLFNYLDEFEIETKLTKLLDKSSKIFCFVQKK
jgi:hypothetical protein